MTISCIIAELFATSIIILVVFIFTITIPATAFIYFSQSSYTYQVDIALLVMEMTAKFISMITIFSISYNTLYYLYIIKYSSEFSYDRSELEANGNYDDNDDYNEEIADVKYLDNILLLKKMAPPNVQNNVAFYHNLDLSTLIEPLEEPNLVEHPPPDHNDYNSLQHRLPRHLSQESISHKVSITFNPHNTHLPFQMSGETCDDPLTPFNRSLTEPQYRHYHSTIFTPFLQSNNQPDLRGTTIQEQSTPTPLYRICPHCSHIQPPRTHHSQSTQRCHLLFDHYCLVLNCIIDFRNRRSFYMFLVYLIFGCVWVFFNNILFFTPKNSHNLQDKHIFISLSYTMLEFSTDFAKYAIIPLILVLWLYTQLWIINNMTTVHFLHNLRQWIHSCFHPGSSPHPLTSQYLLNHKINSPNDQYNTMNTHDLAQYIPHCFDYGLFFVNFLAFFHSWAVPMPSSDQRYSHSPSNGHYIIPTVFFLLYSFHANFFVYSLPLAAHSTFPDSTNGNLFNLNFYQLIFHYYTTTSTISTTYSLSPLNSNDIYDISAKQINPLYHLPITLQQMLQNECKKHQLNNEINYEPSPNNATLFDDIAFQKRIETIFFQFFSTLYHSKRFHHFPLNGISHRIMYAHRASVLSMDHFDFDDDHNGEN